MINKIRDIIRLDDDKILIDYWISPIGIPHKRVFNTFPELIGWLKEEWDRPEPLGIEGE